MAGTVPKPPRDQRPLLDIFTAARTGPPGTVRFTDIQLDQISRTVRHAPEVMVKVTGGATRAGAVRAHLAYISRKEHLEIETDAGEHLSGKEQRDFIKSWHLELSPGQYRQSPHGSPPPRALKLVHNIVLSMPQLTPPDKVLKAARIFARENFGLKYRYAMALHTDQEHPHVHLVVKAEGSNGRRLHIGKATLRQWREDFAQLMRNQGIPANATSRALRGRINRRVNDRVYRTEPKRSRVMVERVRSMISEVHKKGAVSDPARAKLLQTRDSVVQAWKNVATSLEAQGQWPLADDVWLFLKQLPAVRTDRERLAEQYMDFLKKQSKPDVPRIEPREKGQEREPDRTR